MNEEKINEVKTAIENLNIQIINNNADIKKENNRQNVLLEMRLNGEVTKEAYHVKFEEVQIRIQSLYSLQSKLDNELINSEILINKLKNTKLEDLVADVSVFKKYINQVIESIKIYRIQNLGVLQKEFSKKQDTVLFIEMTQGEKNL